MLLATKKEYQLETSGTKQVTVTAKCVKKDEEGEETVEDLPAWVWFK
jgi:hypothetical protein